jgi:L-lactate dehydrogenase complex protein LldG
MAAEGQRIGAEVIPCETIDEARAALRRIVSETGSEWTAEKRVVCAKRSAVDRLHAAATLDVPVFVVNPETPVDSRAPAGRKQQVIEKAAGAVAGVTEADFLIAGAAACVMRAHPDQPRALSLLPSVHIAVAGIDRLVADLDELYAILRHDPIERTAGVSRALTIVAGPSKTADIEATLVHGAHGPRRFVILVVNDFLT